MRKPKDFDSELKALDERAKQLRTRKLHQLGELVVGTGADALPIDILAGALLAAAERRQGSAGGLARTRRSVLSAVATSAGKPWRECGQRCAGRRRHAAACRRRGHAMTEGAGW
jgi:hypothetical protein